MRNVFVEGAPESVEIVKQMLSDIVENQRKMKLGMRGQQRVELRVPGNMVGLVIGKNGETVKSINQRTGVCFLIIKQILYGVFDIPFL